MNTVAQLRASARFQVGDVVETPRFLYRHVGLVIGQYDDGCWAVLTGTPNGGTHHTRLCEFAEGRPVRVIERHGDRISQDQILRRMNRILGRDYSVLNWNCEHVVRHALGLVPASPQVQGWLTAGVAVSLVSLAVAGGDRSR